MKFALVLQSILLVSGLACSASVFSQQTGVPANAADYTRTTHFTYNADGTLATSTIEKDVASACSVTSYGYDPVSGNVTSTTVANCADASDDAKFATRKEEATYAAWSGQIKVGGVDTSVGIAAGIFRDTVSNTLGHTTKLLTDPRFGIPLSITDPNSVKTSAEVDDFGRVVKAVRSDGTMTLTAYCLLAGGRLDNNQTSNSAGCPSTFAANEVPVDAVAFTATEPRDVSGNTKIGPLVKEYFDRLGRSIRRVTEGFDGPNQPANRSAAIVVSDTIFNAYGAKILVTQPYFLASGSSTLSGSNDVGVTKFSYDLLGRITEIAVADEKGTNGTGGTGAGFVSFGDFGSKAAALTLIQYEGTTRTTINDQNQKKIEISSAAGQLLRVEDATGAQIAYLYDAFGNLTRTVDALQNTITMTFDIRGRRVVITDPDKGLVTTTYDAIGQVRSTQNAAQEAYGRAIDKDQKTKFTYDGLGRMTLRTELERNTAWYYDKASGGATCPSSVSTKGLLCEVIVDTGVRRRLYYDAKSRLNMIRLETGATDTAATPVFHYGVVFDSNTGRVASQVYPSRLWVNYNYSTLGYLKSLSLPPHITSAEVASLPGSVATSRKTFAASEVLWQANEVNAWGALESEKASNGIVTKREFEGGTGRATLITAGSAGQESAVQNLGLVWDSLGNLTGRTDEKGDGTQGQPTSGAVTETFLYDALNRLGSYKVEAPGVPGYSRTVNLHYNALGMLLYKSDVGNYSYSAQGNAAVRPHAVRSVSGVVYDYDENGNLTSASDGKYKTLTYTQFDKVAAASNADLSVNYAWNYDENQTRLKQTSTTAGNTRTTWYVNSGPADALAFEWEVNSAATPNAKSLRIFLKAWGRTVGVLASTSGPLSGLPAGGMTSISSIGKATTVSFNKLEYWHTDHLGSVVATTDHNGDVTQRYAYDPFGKRRHVTGSYDEFGTLILDWNPNSNKGTARGFTEHEHLDDLGIVNMNGRIYDPRLGLFMQADPHVPFPNQLQSYNRYSYVENNPLNQTDPSGFAGETSTGNDSGPGAGLSSWWEDFKAGLSSAWSSFTNTFFGSSSAVSTTNNPGLAPGPVTAYLDRVDVSGTATGQSDPQANWMTFAQGWSGQTNYKWAAEDKAQDMVQRTMKPYISLLPDSGKAELIRAGGLASGRIDSELEKRALDFWLNGNGKRAEFKLSVREFADISGGGKYDLERAVHGRWQGLDVLAVSVNTYHMKAYDYVIGIGTLYLYKGAHEAAVLVPVGFSDTYNFDKGNRSPLAEFATRSTETARPKSAADFMITYP